ncbi:MAG: PEGA domain-containing protein [Lentisphaeria bacterium]|nr:PEGA domain-containing protein [Lentisphaeria bacterium]
MKKLYFTALTAMLALVAASDFAADGTVTTENEKKTTTTTTTTTVITETVRTKAKEKPAWKPFKVCVLDFTSIDISGQVRFLDGKNDPIVIPAQNTLNDADHRTINSIMQGYVRMIDAWDNSWTNSANREAQVDDNVFTRKKAIDLYNTIVKGAPRPMVIGAEYLSAYLGKHNDVFGTMDVSQVAAAMQKLQKQDDFPRDFMLRIAKETGATHLIYGTVGDIHSRTRSFSGYGINTNTTTYELDVTVKMIDLAAQHSVYSNVYTGSCREQRPVSNDAFDNNIFLTLMKSALEQAAEDLYDVCKEGRKNKVTVTPMPYMITVTPTAGDDFKASQATVYADGIVVGTGGEAFPLPEGAHKIEIKADGYQTRTLTLDVKSDQTVTTTLER